jgi:predicted RNA-binding protein Jag
MELDNNPPDFAGALAAEFGFTPEPVTPPTPPAPAADSGVVTPPAAEVKVPPVAEVPAIVEPPKPQGGEADDKTKTPDPVAPIIPINPPKQETAEEIAQRQAEEAAAAIPKYATADDVKNAIRELNSETTARVEKLHTATEQIISILHPEGIDKNLYDTTGKVIRTAQDIVDRGLQKENGEPYTYDEAASFVLEANRKMGENIEELNKWAGNVAEQNISLMEGNQRVMGKWGDILTAMPELAKQLAEKYISTQLQFDKTNSYITNMAMQPEDFYDLTMAPYRKLGEALVAKQGLEAAEAARTAKAADDQKVADQNERNGIPPQRGSSNVKANTGDPMLDALVDELNK